MKHKLLSTVCLLLILIMVFAGCGQKAPSGGTGTTSDQVTIRFFHKWPEPEHMEYFNYVIQEFERNHPTIKIKMEAVADEPYKDKIRVLMASGEVPDIYFSWAGEFSWKFARAGQALDLTDALMNSDWKDKIILSAVEPYEWQGKVYGIPMRINAKFMVYNKGLFEKYNLQVPKTWDEFLVVCEKLKQNGVTPIAFGNEYPWASSHYVGDFNAKLVPVDVRLADYLLTAPPDQLFTDPGYIEALSRFKLLMDKGFYNEGANGISHSGARSSFVAGKAGMMYVELEEFPTIAEGMGRVDFGFFEFPSGTGGRGDQRLITGAPDGFMVYSKTKYPQEAIEFLKFLTSPEMGKEYVKRLGIPSAAVGAVNSETALPVVVEGVNAINKANGMALWLDTDINAKIVEVYLPGMQALINGTKTPEQVMAEVQQVARTVQQELKSQQ